MSLGNLDRKDIAFVVFKISKVSIPSSLFIFFLSYDNTDNVCKKGVCFLVGFYERVYH